MVFLVIIFALFCFSSHCHTPSGEDQLKREKGYFDSLFQPRAEFIVCRTGGKEGTPQRRMYCYEEMEAKREGTLAVFGQHLPSKAGHW